MDIPQRDISTAYADKLVLSNIKRILAGAKDPSRRISTAPVPIFGILWGIKAVRRATSDRLRKAIWPIRNSKMEKQIYERAMGLWSQACETQNGFPASWCDWRIVIERFNLDDDTSLATRVWIIESLVNLGWGSPANLARIQARLLRGLFPDAH